MSILVSPLDLAALNAEKIIKCTSNKNIAFKLLDNIYKNQNKWAVGEDINKINNSLINLSVKFDLKKEELDKCLKDENLQDQILSQRIERKKIIKYHQLQPFLSMIKFMMGNTILNLLKNK